ncbi:hypothetical protein [Pseudonocardia broussonetiae]|uniref:Uncharacterized protein n=1 Tax=Pseudonocardia broussonetiae TaxID=2736640 RepID=A0A6M6JPN7_9PSEU|nr:hypothetical protein [Pseudonocardia broussonetiae]QJY48917.1 hypothetical protein HOP40_26660 [Pseudonocardia broussonetiae]
MPTRPGPDLRERVSDTLLRVGTENALDSADLVRELSGVDPRTPGYASAAQAVAVARWVDSAVLWLSWRLRPRTITVPTP